MKNTVFSPAAGWAPAGHHQRVKKWQSMWRPFYASDPFNSTLARCFMFGGFFKISFKPCLNMVETFLLLCCCYSVSLISVHPFQLWWTRANTLSTSLCAVINGTRNSRLSRECRMISWQLRRRCLTARNNLTNSVTNIERILKQLY